MTAYLTAMFIFACIYTLLALGLNLQWGHTGLVNLGHVAFFAVGGYTSALLTLAGQPIVVGLAAGALLAGFLGYVLGVVSVRLKEDYLAIVTLAFAEIVRLILLNETWTGGPNGLPGVPRLLGSLDRFTRPPAQLALLVVVVALAIVAMHRLTESPFGRVLRAMRDDEVAVEYIGKDVPGYRLTVLVVGSAIAGVAGSFYAHYIGYVSPDQFLPIVTFYVWVAITLGGNSHWGATLGTLVFFALLEGTRFVGDFGLPVDDTLLAHLRMAAVGAVLILLLRFRPDGLLPYRPRHRVGTTEAGGMGPDAGS